MNLHETLTNPHSIAHAVPVPSGLRQGDKRVPRSPAAALMAFLRPRHSLLIGLAVLGALLFVPMGASAATCDTHEMIDAAANGRQISAHAPACYRQALAELPGDVDGYAPQVRASLLQAMRRDERISVQSSGGTISRELASANDPAVAASVRGPVTDLLEGLGPSHVDQVPAPVVVLGGLASLLLLAGLGTSLARVRARRLSR
jgi:hypothetical protein